MFCFLCLQLTNERYDLSFKFELRVSICDALCKLVSFVQVKKREKHAWRIVTFSKVAGVNLQLY